MSSEKLQKSNTAKLAHKQANDLVRECLQKKFNGNRRMMHVWLTGEDDEKITGLRVEQWANKTRVPGWVVLRIFTEFPDLRDFAFAALPAEQVDPQVAALYKRLDRLLQKKFLFVYFQLQATLCEALIGLEAQELERIMKTTAEVVANALTHSPDSAVFDPTSKNTK